MSILIIFDLSIGPKYEHYLTQSNNMLYLIEYIFFLQKRPTWADVKSFIDIFFVTKLLRSFNGGWAIPFPNCFNGLKYPFPIVFNGPKPSN